MCTEATHRFTKSLALLSAIRHSQPRKEAKRNPSRNRGVVKNLRDVTFQCRHTPWRKRSLRGITRLSNARKLTQFSLPLTPGNLRNRQWRILFKHLHRQVRGNAIEIDIRYDLFVQIIKIARRADLHLEKIIGFP